MNRTHSLRGCGRCSGLPCTATWARSVSTWCRGGGKAHWISRCVWRPNTVVRCVGGDEMTAIPAPRAYSTAFGFLMAAAAAVQAYGLASSRQHSPWSRCWADFKFARPQPLRCCWRCRRSSSPIRHPCSPRCPDFPRPPTWCCVTRSARPPASLPRLAPTMIAAVGFALAGVVATSFAPQLPWSPLLAPVVVFAIYAVAARPFLGDRRWPSSTRYRPTEPRRECRCRLTRTAVGAKTEPQLFEWTDRDTLLYALGVGARHRGFGVHHREQP